MAQVLSMRGRRAGISAPVCFDRAELVRLLALYSQRVADGEWRDYAIGHFPERAEFAVYRHSWENPLFTISKWTGHGGARWEVASGRRRLHHGGSLDEVLSVFRPPLRVAY